MKKILILSSDTLHHRYFINALEQAGIKVGLCIFETTHVTEPFPVSPFFEEEKHRFEMEHFFSTLPYDLALNPSEVENINSDLSLEKISVFGPDLGLVFGTRKISSRTIALFKDGLINVHRGIASQYRGLDSAYWAMYHGDHANIGVTIHKVDDDLDTGAIILEKPVPLVKDMKIYQLRYHATVMATTMVMAAVKDYLAGALRSYPQSIKGRYYSFMPLEMKKIVAKRFEKYCHELTS